MPKSKKIKEPYVEKEQTCGVCGTKYYGTGFACSTECEIVWLRKYYRSDDNEDINPKDLK
jgi:hypothetical protein